MFWNREDHFEKLNQGIRKVETFANIVLPLQMKKILMTLQQTKVAMWKDIQKNGMSIPQCVFEILVKIFLNLNKYVFSLASQQ